MNEFSKQEVERQIRDWKKRIAELYADIQLWLKDTENLLKPGTKYPMYEEPMYRCGIPKTEMDSAVIVKGKQSILTVIPKGLWVIGTKGRIDILAIKKSYILIDAAEFKITPDWILYNGNLNKGVSLNKQSFLEILDSNSSI